MESRKLIILSLFSFLVLGLLSSSLYAASFDCEKATSNIEQMICSNPELSERDEKLAMAYQQVLKRVADPELLKAQQRAWLILRDKCTKSSCVLSAYGARLNRLTNYNYYKPVKGKGLSVCTAYEKTLNSAWPRLPFVCGRPASKALGITKPKWSFYGRGSGPTMGMTYEAFNAYSNYLWQHDVNPVRYFHYEKVSDWKGTPGQYREARKHFEYDRDSRWQQGNKPGIADFDIDNDGKTEHVYYEQNCGSVWGDQYAVLSSDYKTIDERKTTLVTPYPSFKKMGLGVFRPVKKGDWGIAPFFIKMGFSPVEDPMVYAHLDFFFYKDRTYIDQWWSNHPSYKGKSDIDAGLLRVFSSNSSGTKEVCTYRFIYNG